MRYPHPSCIAIWPLFALTAVLSWSTVSCHASPAVTMTEPATASDVSGNNTFALNLHRRVATAEQGGSVISPWSLRIALAMVYAGAGGETAAQIHEALALEGKAALVHTAFNEDLQRLTGIDEIALGNRLWVQSGFDLLQPFRQTLEGQYGAPPSPVDFSVPEAARDTINSWIGDATGGRVGELIPAGVLDSRTRLVLTNAIHFEGDWELPFAVDSTSSQPFFVSAGHSTEVELMQHQGTHGYVEDDDVQFVELAYAGTDLAMQVILPKEGRNLGSIEQDLSAGRLADLQERLTAVPVSVILPRFKLADRMRADSILKTMGMQLAFDRNLADLSGIDGRKLLYLAAVLHGAFIDVNERGTEAGAASAAVINTRALRLPAQFRADRPFLFIIAERSSGMILFIGRLTDPSRLGS